MGGVAWRPVDNRYLEAGADELDVELELDLSELDLDFSVAFGLSADFSAGLSDDFSDLSDFSDDELDDSPLEALMELFAASRLSLR